MLFLVIKMTVSTLCRQLLPIWDYKADMLLLRHPVVWMPVICIRKLWQL